MDLRLKIDEILRGNNAQVSDKTKAQIIEELHIYHEELYFQNEELKRLNEEMSEMHLQFKLLFQKAPVAYLYIDLDGQIVECNEYFEKKFGKTIKKEKIYKFIHEEDQDIFYQFFRQLKNEQDTLSAKIRLKKGLQIFYMKMSGNRIVVKNQTMLLVSFSDITDEQQFLSDIQELTYKDQLTGLFNRRFFQEELMRIDTKRNLPIGIISLDINGLKLINDTFGHEYGDALLKKSAETLKKLCREDEIIARLGGDEFVILVHNIELKQLNKLYKRLMNGTASIQINGVSLSIALGFSLKENEFTTIHDTIRDAEKMMYRNKLYMNSTQNKNIIDGILATLHEKHPCEASHSNRVSQFMENLAQQMSLDESQRIRYKTLGLLHDIGKIAIDYAILDKKGPLTDDEMDEVKRHPEIGYRILKSAGIFADIIEPVLTHHERLDGKGYPRKMGLHELSIEARALMICDSFDAITSDRPYRKSRSYDEAIQEMKKHVGTQFDGHLLGHFFESIESGNNIQVITELKVNCH